MYSFVLLACTSFLFALLLTPLIRNAALARGLVDRPGPQSRLHARVRALFNRQQTVRFHGARWGARAVVK